MNFFYNIYLGKRLVFLLKTKNKIIRYRLTVTRFQVGCGKEIALIIVLKASLINFKDKQIWLDLVEPSLTKKIPHPLLLEGRRPLQ